MNGIILEAKSIKKEFGTRTLLDVDRLEIYEGERIGLVGENGAGKSTLISILAGISKPDEGRVRINGSFALIRQTGLEHGEITDRAASEFGVPSNTDGLSGGEKTRRRMAAAFSNDTNLLFADEPTTDLDAEGIDLLRKRLKGYRGALLMVSHDRALLDLVCDRIWYLEDGKITDFPGGYADFRRELDNRRGFQQFEYEQYRKEQARLKASAQKLREMTQQVRKAPSRMGNSEARLHKREATDAVLQLSHRGNVISSRMERLEKKERPRDLPEIRMALGANNPVEARYAVTAQRVSMSIGKRQLLKDAGFFIPSGRKTALMGENGCGKTTLLKAMCGSTGSAVKLTGSLKLNPAVQLGWFDQDHAQTLIPEKSALENVMHTAVCDESTARTVMARLNIKGEDVFKPVSALSGGEKAKTALSKLLVSGCNMLVLDEPTNHLDVFTLEELEQMLSAYAGTLLVVSHDRAFIQNTAERILVFENGMIRTFEGSLEQLETDKHKDVSADALKIELTSLQMRQAAIAARLSAPKKGDSPEKLNAEYEAVQEEIVRVHRLIQK